MLSFWIVGVEGAGDWSALRTVAGAIISAVQTNVACAKYLILILRIEVHTA